MRAYHANGFFSHTHAMTTHAMFAPYKSRVVSRGGLLLPLTYLPGTSVEKKLRFPARQELCCLIIIMISCIHANIVYTLQTAETTRARKDFSAGHYTMYLYVKHFSLHFCCGGICHKVSFRQQGFTL